MKSHYFALPIFLIMLFILAFAPKPSSKFMAKDSLSLDGMPLTLKTISSSTTGILSIFREKSGENLGKIGFKVAIKKKDDTIEYPKFAKEELLDLDIQDVLAYCETGDYLLLKPSSSQSMAYSHFIKVENNN